jgi:3'-phosphoadenosine 5'-phosphosulfate sulfotransferase
MSDLDTETNSNTVTVEHLGRTWTVPAKRHLSHIRAMKAELRLGLALSADFLAELFLGEDQFADLLEIDPDEDSMTEFGVKIAKALGTEDSGNS